MNFSKRKSFAIPEHFFEAFLSMDFLLPHCNRLHTRNGISMHHLMTTSYSLYEMNSDICFPIFHWHFPFNGVCVCVCALRASVYIYSVNVLRSCIPLQHPLNSKYSQVYSCHCLTFHGFSRRYLTHIYH